MGDAIARFRQAAHAARHDFDFRFFSPLAATEENHAYFGDMLTAFAESASEGTMPAAEYADYMAEMQASIESEYADTPRRRGQRNPLTQPPRNGPRPRPDDLRNLAAEAVVSALAWGHLATSIEGRVVRLLDAHEKLHLGMLDRRNAIEEAQNALGLTPGDLENFCIDIMPDLLAELAEDDEKRQKQYAAALAAWFVEYLALGSFIGEPPAAAATSEKKTGGSRGRGGRPPNDEALARDLLDGWRAYEPEDGRKTKPRYLAQRDDVMAVKTEQARQRKIASLLVALNSALHLQREKTKQKQRARG
jgi:hypothetical protein